jgi:hypothetical protein
MVVKTHLHSSSDVQKSRVGHTKGSGRWCKDANLNPCWSHAPDQLPIFSPTQSVAWPQISRFFPPNPNMLTFN